jgi:NAD(P)-dependent dehydrogenase (short-subunit alcohol dehydrogenase family)
MTDGPTSLNERVAIVTGAARGIGAAIAERLVGAGASVVLADRDVDGARQAAACMAGLAGRACAVGVDLADRSSILGMVDQAQQAYGPVSILVNNAGIMFRTRFGDIDLDEWNATLQVNLTGPFLCTQAVMAGMKEAGFGRIVNIASSAGRSVSTLGGAHYTASKAGLLGLTRAVAKEMAPHGVTVNAVCPGLIDTQMARDTTSAEELQGFIEAFPAQRLGTPAEIGNLVVFLCSTEAGYITGASVDINGGDLMM